MDLDRDACYRVICSHDARFDGRFFTAVKTTGVFCRPICPARTPKLENCVFLPSAAAALKAGFRPCRRCLPELSPDLRVRGSSGAISRALNLIAEGLMDQEGVDGLARRVGLSARQLRRLFARHLGASPAAVAQTRRILFAKKLIGETSLSLTEVAHASGYRSLRRFNAVMREALGRSPRDLRRSEPSQREPAHGIALKLAYAPPLNWNALMRYLKPRAIPGVELVDGASYSRSIEIDGEQGIVEVRPHRGRDQLVAIIHLRKVASLSAVVTRLRRMFDLDADCHEISRHLGKDPGLASRVFALPGLRLAGAWDPFELSVRAILGQQVSVAAATTLAGRLVEAYGRKLSRTAGQTPSAGPKLLFPLPEQLAGADLTALGMPGKRAAAVSGLAAAAARDEQLFSSFTTLEEIVARLVELPGIGEWTAQYIAMRALGEPDAFPGSDLGLLKAWSVGNERATPTALSHAAQRWRPWRGYAAMYLWLGDSIGSKAASRSAWNYSSTASSPTLGHS